MLKLTDRARDHLARIRSERSTDDAKARFVASPSGGGVRLTFATSPEEGDRVLRAGNVDVFAAPAVADRLEGSVIDAGEGKDGKIHLLLKGRRKASQPARSV